MILPLITISKLVGTDIKLSDGALKGTAAFEYISRQHGDPHHQCKQNGERIEIHWRYLHRAQEGTARCN